MFGACKIVVFKCSCRAVFFRVLIYCFVEGIALGVEKAYACEYMNMSVIFQGVLKSRWVCCRQNTSYRLWKNATLKIAF